MSGDKDLGTRGQKTKKKERREIKSPEAQRFLALWADTRRMFSDAGFKPPAAFLSDCLLDIPETAQEASRLAESFRKKQKDLENVAWMVHVGRDGLPYVDIECW